MARLPNPVRGLILAVGLGLARLGLVDAERARRAVDLAWPRIVTGLARMSKSAADVAMVGVAVGPAAIAGVGFAGPYWGAAFTVGGGLAAGTIALVSQRFGAEAFDELDQAVRSSVLLVVLLTLPLAALFWLAPEALIRVLTADERVVALGAAYLGTVALGVPFAGLNLVGSRTLIGADDSWIPMVVRAGGAVVNIGLNAVFIFGLGMGVVGAAWGTVISNVVVTAAFVVGLLAGRLPGVGPFPITVSPRGRYLHLGELRDLVTIGLPVVGRNGVWTLARFPMLAFVGLFGPTVVAAYVISRRVWGLMNTPGWGFGLAASSLVGQSLGEADEATAESYGREIVLISVGAYAIFALVTFVFAEPIVTVFVGSRADPTVPIAAALVRVASVAVVAQGVNSGIAGALDATGDTRWPFYSRVLGMVGLAIPLVYLGATTSLGLLGVYLAYFAESVVPAAINYYRFSTGKWRAISRGYRPESALPDD
ncbi:MAG: MATE family efflux transporter [Halobacteriales archaeon]|nr:MATE family efflux transporter [Halobacteriales archaeon]